MVKVSMNSCGASRLAAQTIAADAATSTRNRRPTGTADLSADAASRSRPPSRARRRSSGRASTTPPSRRRGARGGSQLPSSSLLACVLVISLDSAGGHRPTAARSASITSTQLSAASIAGGVGQCAPQHDRRGRPRAPSARPAGKCSGAARGAQDQAPARPFTAARRDRPTPDTRPSPVSRPRLPRHRPRHRRTHLCRRLSQAQASRQQRHNPQARPAANPQARRTPGHSEGSAPASKAASHSKGTDARPSTASHQEQRRRVRRSASSRSAAPPTPRSAFPPAAWVRASSAMVRLRAASLPSEP